MRRPCENCPWKKSTPRGGFPGGKLNTRGLEDMISGRSFQVMQCHATPDGRPSVCVGFARRCPDTVGLRIAQMLQMVDLSEVDFEQPLSEELHTLDSVLRKHGVDNTEPCKTRCRGCISEKCAAGFTRGG